MWRWWTCGGFGQNPPRSASPQHSMPASTTSLPYVEVSEEETWEQQWLEALGSLANLELIELIEPMQWHSMDFCHAPILFSPTPCDMAIRAGSKETCTEIRFKDGPCPRSVLLFPFQASIQFQCSLPVSSLRQCHASQGSKKRASMRSKYNINNSHI